MDKYRLNFSGVTGAVGIHEVIMNGLEFPEYYGANTDALWDCMTDMLGDPTEIEIVGFENVKKQFAEEWSGIMRIMQRVRHAYSDKYLSSFVIYLIHKDGSREELK